MKLITDTKIRADLERFYERLQVAKNKLSNLPAGYLSYQENKKREQKRKILTDEIEHVERLIKIAQEALADSVVFEDE